MSFCVLFYKKNIYYFYNLKNINLSEVGRGIQFDMDKTFLDKEYLNSRLVQQLKPVILAT
jgi:hypothetical protein